MVSRLLQRLGRRRRVTGHDDPFVDALIEVLGPDRVKVDGAHRALLSHDASVYEGGVSGPICYPETAQEVQAVVRLANQHGRNITPRGAGTGLAGGAIPLGLPVVVAVTRMNRVLEVDEVNRVAWVEPGVVNLDLTRYLTPMGYHFAPDPSSQQVCTIGGNVANNSGGPHCLAYGVTNAHVLAMEVVLPSGELVTLGGLDPEPAGLDLLKQYLMNRRKAFEPGNVHLPRPRALLLVGIPGTGKSLSCKAA